MRQALVFGGGEKAAAADAVAGALGSVARARDAAEEAGRDPLGRKGGQKIAAAEEAAEAAAAAVKHARHALQKVRPCKLKPVKARVEAPGLSA